MKENDFSLNEATSKRYAIGFITGADYADDLALLANTVPQIESLL